MTKQRQPAKESATGPNFSRAVATLAWQAKARQKQRNAVEASNLVFARGLWPNLLLRFFLQACGSPQQGGRPALKQLPRIYPGLAVDRRERCLLPHGCCLPLSPFSSCCRQILHLLLAWQALLANCTECRSSSTVSFPARGRELVLRPERDTCNWTASLARAKSTCFWKVLLCAEQPGDL